MRKHLAAGALTLACLAYPAAANAAQPTTDPCPNAAIRAQQGSTHLPDCRAYELVSPAQKNGYKVGPNSGIAAPLAVSPDGDTTFLTGFYPLPPAEGGSLGTTLASRGSDSWTATGVFPKPGPVQPGYGVPGMDGRARGATPDLQSVVYYDATTPPYGSLWKVDADGTRKRIADSSAMFFAGQANWGQAQGQPWFQGISDDGDHVVFSDTDALVPGVVSNGKEILYEWVDDGANDGAGTLRVVDRTNGDAIARVDPDANAALGANPDDAARGFNGGPRGGAQRGDSNAISADGEVIVFQTPPVEAVPNSERTTAGGPVYARVGGEETIGLSAPASGHTPSQAPTRYRYLDASHSATDPDVDGRFVFFWADGDLTADAPQEGGIYRYDIADRALVFVGAAATYGGGGETVESMPRALASDDGRRLYVAGSEGVRLFEGGSGKAVLDPGFPEGGPAQGSGSIGSGLDSPLARSGCPSASLSPDGRFFAFAARVAAGDLQVFRYDAELDELKVVSETPFAPDSYDAGFASMAGCSSDPAPPTLDVRVMSDDGEYVYFSTVAALVPGDTNGTWDAYQWHDDEISLISSGADLKPTHPYLGDAEDSSLFMGVDRSGLNPVIVTEQQLAAQDGDSVADFYAARVGGGFAHAGAPAPCVGDGCRAPAAAAPGVGQPGSVGYRGRGDARAVRSCMSLASRLGGLRARGRSLARRARQASGREARRLRRRAASVRRQARAVERRTVRCRSGR